MDTKSRLLVYLSPTVVVLLITFFGQGSRHVARAASFIDALRSGGFAGVVEYLKDDEYRNATPLLKAVMQSDILAVAELVSAKRRHSVHNSSGAARLLRLLHNNDPIDFAVGGEGMEALLQVNHSQIAKILLSAYVHAKSAGRLCANIDERNSNGYTALENAVYCGNSEIVALLLSYGADPNQLAKEGGDTLLMGTVRIMCDSADAAATARLLLAAGVDPEATNREGKTALDYAISCDSNKTGGNVEVAHVLIKNGANVNACDQNGHSLLFRFLNGLPFSLDPSNHYTVSITNMVRMLLKYAMPLTEGEKRKLGRHQRGFLEGREVRKIADQRVTSVFQWCEHIKEKENLPDVLMDLIIQIGGEVSEKNILTYAKRLGRG